MAGGLQAGPPLSPAWIAAAAAAAWLVLLLLEWRRPLRAMVEPKTRRTARNLTLAGLSAAAVQLTQVPVLVWVAGLVETQRVGLVNRLPLPYAARVALAVLLLDYTLWHWHWLTHKVPLLWRFHRVHHVDRDMDASTALRFHFGEMVLSVPYRALQVAVIGADPFAVGLWQALLLVSILFHHSNVRLPIGLERTLVRLVVTPRMHGIHHSQVRHETDSNWSSLISAWDYLHGTLLLDVPQQAVEIGVPAYRDPTAVTLGKALWLPFRRRSADWAGGDLRAQSASAPWRLAE
jgi:sterol desaturase/sphingolipid hydroxylase (fatty acid hydroxylase superfamily)